MFAVALVALAAIASGPGDPPPSSQRLDRLVALARLDAAVRYFDPAVATRASSWDSLFAANVIRIADAPTAVEYRARVTALMRALHPEAPSRGAPQRVLEYQGFPTALMQSSGGYRIGWRDGGDGRAYRVDMGEGVHAEVPLSELGGDLTGPVPPLPPPTDAAWRAAHPAPGYRVLAAARIWGTIHYFFPYKGLMNERWDERLREALPSFEGARDSLAYAQAVARLAAHIHDTHVTISSRTLSLFTGAVPIGAAARLVEDQLVITRLVDSSAIRAGLRVGDVVRSIDGEPVARRIARLTPFFSASTPQSLRYRLQSALLRGEDTRGARLVVRGADGADRVLVVPRAYTYGPPLQKQRDGSIVRILPGNIGYVDLDRLPAMMVDSAFRLLAGTTAIIFDDRGYPMGTAWAIAPRLNTHPEPTVAAKFRRLIVPSPDTARTTAFEFDQSIPAAGPAPKYTGRTVMLIDERTISQAEHTGLFLESANGTTFIGSPTMGANGDITVLALPGGISMTFTGHDVRHADGRQLQRVGLQPHLAVTPTIAGIRAGRDEVLEAAWRSLGGTGELPPDTVRIPAPALMGVPSMATLPGEPEATGWVITGTGPDAYRLGLDRGVAHGGTASGHITARSTTPAGFASLAQLLRAEHYRGKRIRFSASVKTRDVGGGGARLWLRVDGNGGMLAFDNMGPSPITGTTDWTLVSLVLDVPADADGLALGFLLNGRGEAWVDDASIEVVDATVAPTSTMSSAPDSSKAEAMRRTYARAPEALQNPGFEPR